MLRTDFSREASTLRLRRELRLRRALSRGVERSAETRLQPNDVLQYEVTNDS